MHLFILSLKQLYTVNMMTSSNGNTFLVTGALCREFTGQGEFSIQKPVTQSFDIFFDLRVNKTTVRLMIWDAIMVIMTSM